MPRATRFMRPSSHALEHLGDLARAADRAQPVVGEPDDPELATPPPGSARSSSCSAPRRCAAGRPRSAARRGPSGNSGKSADAGPHDDPSLRAGPVIHAMSYDRARLVPARPARARPSAAARGAGRVRARGAGLRARRPRCCGRSASEPRRAFLFACLRDLRDGAAASAAATSSSCRGTARAGAAEARARARRDRGLLRLRRLAVRDGAATGAWWRRCARRASSRAARPGNFIADIGKAASPTPSSRRSGGPGRSCRGARSTARRARSPRPVRTCTVGEIPAAKAEPWLAPGGEPAGRRAHAGLRPHDLRRRHDRLDRRHPMLLALPALRRDQRPRARGARQPAAPTPRQLAWRDFYAHVLLHNPGNTHARVPPRARRDRVGRHRRALRRLAGGPHRLPARRRRHAPARARPAGCTTAPG